MQYSSHKFFSNKIIKASISILIALCLCLSTFLVALTSNPQKAYAYDTVKANIWYVSINANITTNGSIQVSENRIVDITKFVEKAKKGVQAQSTASDQNKDASKDANNNQNNSAYLDPLVWDFRAFPEKTDVNASDMRIALINNNDAVVGNWQNLPEVAYQQKWHGNAGPSQSCYSYDPENRQICLYSALVNADKLTELEAASIMTAMSGTSDINTWDITKCEISLNYTIERAAVIYKDVADFQWSYISDSWMADTYDVNLVVKVPIGSASIASPLGKVTTVDPGQNSDAEGNASATTERNIYAWGHGSSNGVVNLNENGLVTLKNDIVPAGSNAEVRIVFPSAWLTNLDKGSDISHEDQTKLATILKEESVWRDWRTNEVNSLILPMIFIVACILVLIFVLILAIVYRKKFQVTEVSTDKLSELHPSVLTRLKDWNREYAHDITASVLFLNDCRLIEIIKQKSGDFKIKALNKKLLRSAKIDNKLDKIDAATINFLFNKCATQTTSITLSDLLNYAKTRSKEFLIDYFTWHAILTDRVNNITGFKPVRSTTRNAVFAIGATVGILGLVLGILFAQWIIAISGLFTALICLIVANSMRNELVFKDKKGNTILSTQIAISFVENSDTLNEFRNKFTKELEECVKSAQDNTCGFDED